MAEEVKDEQKVADEQEVKPVVSAKPLAQRTKVTDLSDDMRQLDFTERNGTTVSLQMVAPSIELGDDIESKRLVMIPDNHGNAQLRQNSRQFHEALFGMFKDAVIVDGKPAGEPVSWEFFDKHSRELFNYVMDQADTFLSNLA